MQIWIWEPGAVSGRLVVLHVKASMHKILQFAYQHAHSLHMIFEDTTTYIYNIYIYMYIHIRIYSIHICIICIHVARKLLPDWTTCFFCFGCGVKFGLRSACCFKIAEVSNHALFQLIVLGTQVWYSCALSNLELVYRWRAVFSYHSSPDAVCMEYLNINLYYLAQIYGKCR